MGFATTSLGALVCLGCASVGLAAPEPSSCSVQEEHRARAGFSHIQIQARSTECPCDNLEQLDKEKVKSLAQLSSVVPLGCELFCINNGCPCLIPWVERCVFKSCGGCDECTGGGTNATAASSPNLTPAPTAAPSPNPTPAPTAAPSPNPTTPAPMDTCFVLDTNYVNADIAPNQQAINAESTEDCQAACVAKAECTHFTFRTAEHITGTTGCWLKNYPGDPQPLYIKGITDGLISGPKVCPGR